MQAHGQCSKQAQRRRFQHMEWQQIGYREQALQSVFPIGKHCIFINKTCSQPYGTVQNCRDTNNARSMHGQRHRKAKRLRAPDNVGFSAWKCVQLGDRDCKDTRFEVP